MDNNAEGFSISAICIPLFPLTYINKPAAVINKGFNSKQSCKQKCYMQSGDVVAWRRSGMDRPVGRSSSSYV